ncbi:MAG: hypothetical protein PVH17_07715 [Anaerolineae bacterium]|jgi:hypothetical protein
MSELVKLVSQKTGLSDELARSAVETVLGYLKDKLPAPVAGQIDGLLGGTSEATDLGGLGKGLRGILGR